MSERWRDLPGTNGKYKISNYGNIARSDNFVEGHPVKLMERRSANTFKYSMDGSEEIIEIDRMVVKAFGNLVCEGTECGKLNCARCGHNPEVDAVRKQHIARTGLSVNEKGRRYLALNDGL